MHTKPMLRSSRVFSLVALFATATLLLPSVSSASQRRPQFRAAVDVIQIQVVVKDGDNFVSGLEAADFALEVDGKSRNITTVYEVNLGADEPEEKRQSRPPAAWRQWILFFDAGFNSPRGVREAQQAAINFIDNQALPDDLIGVAGYAPVYGVRLIVPLTTDRKQVMDGIAGLGLRSAVHSADPAGLIAETMRDGFLGDPTFGGNDVGPGFLTDEIINEMINQVNGMEVQRYTALVADYTEQLGGTLADILATIRGRKQVIFFSKGYADSVLSGASLDSLASRADNMQTNAGAALADASGDESLYGSSDVREALEDTGKALRASDTVIHVVDPSGVGGERDSGLASGGRGAGTFGASGGSRSALSAMAAATGGTTIWNTNDLTDALGDLETSTRRYYVLAFPRERNDTGILDLDLEVTRAGAKITAAPETIASPVHFTDMGPLQKQTQLAEFISKEFDETDLVMDVATIPFAGQDPISRVAVVIELPWEQLEELADQGNDDRIELEIYAYALNEAGTIVDLANRPVGLNFKQMKDSPQKGLPFRYYDLLWAVPGEHRVRVIVRDRELGRISSLTQHITVPQHTGGPLALVGPVSIDWEHPGMVMKGMDPADPPEHKTDGPNAYPFNVGDIELTPAASAAAKGGGIQQFYFVVHNLSRNPFNGQPSDPGLAVDFKDPSGNSLSLARVAVIEQSRDATGGAQMLLGAELPTGLASGYYSLTVIITDPVSGAQTQGTLPLWVGDD